MSELDQSEQSSPPHSPRSVESAAREPEGLRRQGPSLCSVPPHHTAGMEAINVMLTEFTCLQQVQPWDCGHAADMSCVGLGHAADMFCVGLGPCC